MDFNLFEKTLSEIRQIPDYKKLTYKLKELVFKFVKTITKFVLTTMLRNLDGIFTAVIEHLSQCFHGEIVSEKPPQ